MTTFSSYPDKTVLKDAYLAYAKRKLNPVYLSGAIKESILRKMNTINLNKKDE